MNSIRPEVFHAKHSEFQRRSSRRTLARLLRRAAAYFDRSMHDVHESRYTYQSRYRSFSIPAGARVVDVGCGTDPFPFATTLVDLHSDPTEHRHTSLSGFSKPVIIADIHALPFRDLEFDYVYCCHVLEHVEHPIEACRELMRIGRRGYIETPALMKDCLFSWAKGMHRWHVTAIGSRLCFFEYSERLLEGIRSSAFQDVIFSTGRSDLQVAYFQNLDIFNVMFEWNQTFNISLYYQDGTEQHYSPQP